MQDHYELGKCPPSQESIVHNPKIGHLELYGFSSKVLPSPEGYMKRDLTDGRRRCTEDYTMERSPASVQNGFRQPHLVKSL
jgi:hypothetical protein